METQSQSYLRRVWNFLTFSYLDPLLEKGQKDELEITDITLPPDCQARKCYSELREAMDDSANGTTLNNTFGNFGNDIELSTFASSGSDFSDEDILEAFGSRGDVPLLREDGWTSGGHEDDAPEKEKIGTERVPHLVYAMGRCGASYQAMATVFNLITIFCNVGKIFLAQMFFANLFQEDESASFMKGMKIAACLFLASWIGMLCMEYANAIVTYSSVKTKSMAMVAVFRKTLRLNCKSGPRLTKGDIVTYMSTDPTKLRACVRYIRDFWICPIEICVYMALLYRVLGISALFGFLVVLFVAGLNYFSGKILLRKKLFIMDKQQHRMGFFTECLQSILAVKLFGWEEEIYARLKEIRNEEVAGIRVLYYCVAFSTTVMLSTNSLLALVCFTSYSLMGNDLTASVVFPSLYLFSIFWTPLIRLPGILSATLEAYASTTRLQQFLKQKETRPSLKQPSNRDTAVHIHGTFGYRSAVNKQSEGQEGDQGKHEDGNVVDNKRLLQKQVVVEAVKSVDMSARKGSLVMVLGPVGAGKTTLLESILGEVEPLSQVAGVAISGKLAYVPQNAWIRNNTLRNNVTLTDAVSGSELDLVRYEKVLQCCALNVDLRELPAGDETELGEKGYNLSGGQKQRVSLARAVYSNRDIYLLDDPLSAVDAHVGKILLDECICGMLEGKTRILVTHHQEYVKRADYVYMMRDGEVIREGTGEQLHEYLHREVHNEDFQQDIQFTSSSHRSSTPVASSTLGDSPSAEETSEAEREDTQSIGPRMTNSSENEDNDVNSSTINQQTVGGGERGIVGRVTEDEAILQGRVKLSVYKVSLINILQKQLFLTLLKNLFPHFRFSRLCMYCPFLPATSLLASTLL